MTELDESANFLGPVSGWPIDLSRSVVQIIGADGKPAGTGFLVGPRLLVTCAHVVSDYGHDGPPTNAITVVFAHLEGAAFTVQADAKWWSDPDGADIAFLHFDQAPPAHAEPLVLGESFGVRGHQIKTFGFPINAPSAGHYGYGVAGDQIVGDSGTPLLQLTNSTEITNGFSGGPVLDERTGLVIGMVDSVVRPDPLDRGRATAYITPTETLREVCPQLGVLHVCPYRGLEPFDIADIRWFHGRERAVAAVLARLRHEPCFLALLGPSGSGKSSLIHAGVLPTLFPDASSRSDPGWLSVRPETDPFAQLEQAGLTGVSNGLGAAVRRWLNDHPEHKRLVLVIDQFEEILVLTAQDQRTFFLEQLTLLAEQEPAVTVIVGLRDDFYGRLAAAAPKLMRLVERTSVNIPAVLETDELHAIIRRPAEAAGISIEPRLVNRITNDAMKAAPPTHSSSGGAAITVLPLLELALTELWNHREAGRLTHKAYDDIGGVDGGLARWCHEVYQQLPSIQRPLVRRIITSLVRPEDKDSNTPPTRQRRTLAKLRFEKDGISHNSNGQSGHIDAVVATLVNRRMLITSRDPVTNEPVVELVHEALIRKWNLLCQWLEEDHDFLTWLDNLERDCNYRKWATNYGTGAANDAELLRGNTLGHALHWLKLRPDRLSDSVKTFIQLSDQAQQAQDRAEHERFTRERRRVRLLAIALALLAIALALAMALGLYSAFEAVQLTNDRDQTLSRQLAVNANNQLLIDPELSLLLAREAYKVSPTPEAEAALRQAALDSQVRATLSGHSGTVFSVAFRLNGNQVASAGEDGTVRIWNLVNPTAPAVLRGHQGAVYCVAFSSDGKQVASAGEDGTVRIWNLVNPTAPAVLRGHQGAVLGVAFSSDGKRIASAGEDGTVRIWNLVNPTAPAVLRGHQGLVYGVAFSPDGKQVASAGGDGTVRIWNLASPATPAVLSGHRGAVLGVAFSPDGKQVASAGKDATVRIWNTAIPTIATVLSGHQGAVLGVAFSPDGKRVASAGEDAAVRIWDTIGTDDPIVLPGRQGVYGVAFSPDGKQVASAGKDATVRIWNAAGPGDALLLRGHQGTVSSVAFSPDGKQVVSAGGDGTVRIWNLTSPATPAVLSGHRGAVLGVAFSPDGKQVASAGEDGMVRIWNLANPATPAVLRGHQGTVSSVAFSPDGKQVVSAGEDGMVRIWNLADPATPAVLRGHQSLVYGVAFSSDGKQVVSAGGDGTVRIWNLASPATPAVLSGHRGAVLGVAFSPDGKQVASAGEDGMVRIWNLANPATPAVLRGHQGLVYGVAFSSDGKQVASAGGDGTVRIWDTVATSDPVILRSHHIVKEVAFSPHGQQIVSVGADGLVRVWQCQVCGAINEVLTLAQQRSTRGLTCEERAAFLRKSPCP